MKNKAIVFTVYNRTEYLSQTLNAWAKVKDLDQFDIYFRVEPSDKLRQVGDIIKKFANSVKANVHIGVNHKRYGCAKNSYTALDEAFKKYNFVILAEDDIEPSADVANFFSELNNKYMDDKLVGAIVANHEEPGYAVDKVSKVDFFRGLIWGTWKHQWDKYIKDTWDFAYETAGEEGLGGWDWNISLRVFPSNNLKVVVPHASRSQHIGIFGIHSDDKSYYEGIRESFKEDFIWDTLEEK
jgi:GT2 family glycosyltransferase